MAFTTGRSLLPAASAARSVDGRKEKQRGSRQRRQVSGLYPRQTTSVKRNKPRERGNSAGTAAAGDSDSGSRRTVLLSVGGWPLLSVAANAQEELKLLRQEVEYYAREASKILRRKFGKADHPPTAPVYSTEPVDPKFASMLLDVPLDALDAGEVTCMSWSRIKYGADFQTLMSQELPYFRAAGTCGNCGDTSDLSDRAWVDFLAYVQWKAIARQLSGKRQQVNLSPGSYWEAMHNPMPTNDQYESNGTDCDASNQLRRAVGKRLLDAAREAAIPGSPEAEALHGTSPSLDAIRRGVKALLKYFKSTGFVEATAVVFFGASKNEPRNFTMWAEGEAAFLKYWIKGPLTQRGGAALDQEEGFSQDFIGSTIVAYLDGCGVKVSGYRRLNSLASPMLISEQATLRRIRDLPPTDDGLPPDPPFRLELCPDGQEIGCY